MDMQTFIDHHISQAKKVIDEFMEPPIGEASIEGYVDDVVEAVRYQIEKAVRSKYLMENPPEVSYEPR